MSTCIGKGREGWEAKTELPMGTKNRVLVIHTHKTTGGMVTSTQIMTEDKGYMSFMMFGDFSKRTMFKGARCTEKTVNELHQLALNVSDITMNEAAIFYAKKNPGDATEFQGTAYKQEGVAA